MHWVEGGIPLNTFVESHLHRPRMLHDLLGLWVRMARMLRQKQIAHADLQHDNVLLVPRGDGNLALKLIGTGLQSPARFRSISDAVEVTGRRLPGPGRPVSLGVPSQSAACGALA
jgi:hypothetical protein